MIRAKAQRREQFVVAEVATARSHGAAANVSVRQRTKSLNDGFALKIERWETPP
jgi:hypothetical protein